MADKDGKLYFSPEYTFSQLKSEIENKDSVIAAFKDRVKGFYIEPTKKLSGDPFAMGVLCVTTIDFLARIE